MTQSQMTINMIHRRVVWGLLGVRSVSSSIHEGVSCKLLVCGGGAGGCSIAAKFASKLGPEGCVVVEPSDTHYYQPMWTLVGGGLKSLDQSARPMANVLPAKATWIKDSVAYFRPEENKIVTSSGTTIKYDFMVVALGLDTHFEAIPGLKTALEIPESGVCSNYHPKYAEKTFKCVKNFQSGNALFTYPNSPVKCGGAPQKICYLTDALLRKDGKRERAKLKYITSLDSLFSVKKYADKLEEMCKRRDIEIVLRSELIEIRPDSKEAVFRNIDLPYPSDVEIVEFEMLHAVPPMSAPAVLKKTPQLTDGEGFLSIDKETLRHIKFKNIFGVGDCTNLPTAKTAAAVSVQVGVLGRNLAAVMKNKEPTSKYNGYSSCPLVTSLNRGILAEFDYDSQPLESFPFDQGKERYMSFLLKKDIMPMLYWHGLLKGRWNGPGTMRTILHLGFK
ncbi:sulfide:quinone oxidoreductase, mitochondrial-like [Macrosteles quadrilineatus]|uniref:sulfide:quinone oxidoreductase, mitochondrial-like n=1 Tax=Macrosteles quadrilineatus TaxID=74068 RepID=UPI0023E2B3D6|nr:sulfide:quinone oxidoreductase, mitochondrial-like [Macrosteles quadrilineatus]